MITVLTILFLLSMPSGRSDRDPDGLVMQAMTQYLEDAFPDAADRLEVRMLQSKVEIDAGDSIRISISGNGLPRAHTKASVFRKRTTGWERAGWALAYVAHYDSVVVLHRTLNRDHAVSLADLSTAWIEVTRFHGSPLRPDSARTLVARDGALTTRRVPGETALKEGDLRAPFAVDTGNSVAISYQRGTLNLEITGKARQPGRIGDVVRVYSADTNTTYRALIVAPGRAQWIETL